MDSAHKSNKTTTSHIPKRSSSRPRREPFSDLTNATPIPSSRSKPVPDSEPPSDSQPTVPSTAVGDEIGVGKEFTPKSKETSVDFCDDVDNNDKFDISTVYSRRAKTRRKGKEKAAEAASALSCPPLGIGSARLKAHVQDLHKAFSHPCEKSRKWRRHRSVPSKLQKPVLPPDFVEKQKAYFAEIDAFELPEEEVSEDALE